MSLWKRLSLALVAIILMSCANANIGLENANGKSPVVQVVKNVSEAVVQIRVEAKITVTNNTNPFLNDDFFRYFFPQQPQQQQRPVTSMGSGFIYEYNPDTREAFIMTNNHVVEQGPKGTITVTLADKISYPATVVGLDPNTDVAVIKITVKEDERITVAPLGDSSNLDIGDWAIAIGNPFGDIGLDRTVTLGVISALGRANLNFGDNSPVYQDYIQTDAAINPGNSGGPLLNIQGKVIGINAAITSTSGGSIGIGFAIPINLAKRVVDDLVASGKVTRAYIGIQPQEITNDLMEAFELREVSGVLVSNVEKDSPAEKGGLKVGDVIVEFNGEKIPNVSKFRIAVATSKIGDNVPVKIIRENDIMTVNIKLEAFPDEGVVAGDDGTSKTITSSGINIEAIDSQYAKQLGVTSDKGVVIRSVDLDSPAAKSGLTAGMIILKVGQVDVNSPEDYKKAMNDAIKALENKTNKSVRLLISDKTGRNRQFVPLKF